MRQAHRALVLGAQSCLLGHQKAGEFARYPLRLDAAALHQHQRRRIERPRPAHAGRALGRSAWDAPALRLDGAPSAAARLRKAQPIPRVGGSAVGAQGGDEAGALPCRLVGQNGGPGGAAPAGASSESGFVRLHMQRVAERAAHIRAGSPRGRRTGCVLAPQVRPLHSPPPFRKQLFLFKAA